MAIMDYEPHDPKVMRVPKKWRPEGWENPYPPAQFHPVGLIYRDTFEYGADAMLEALRKRGHHVSRPSCFSSLAECCTLRNEDNTGVYVFIPDDEVK